MLEIKERHTKNLETINNIDDNNIKMKSGFGSNITSSMQVENWKNELAIYCSWANIKGIINSNYVILL